MGLALWQVVDRICGEIGGRAVLQTERGGGGLLIVRVMDCPVWTARACALLRLQRPSALVGVEQCIGSLSGFVVVITEGGPPPQTVRRILWVTLAVCAVLFGGSALLHDMEEAGGLARTTTTLLGQVWWTWWGGPVAAEAAEGIPSSFVCTHPSCAPAGLKTF